MLVDSPLPSVLTPAWDSATQGSPYRQYLAYFAPKKLPRSSHFDIAVRRAREKGRLDKDPLVAIRKLVDLKWTEIFQ